MPRPPENDGLCSIWRIPAKTSDPVGDGWLVDSDRAGGTYYISGTAHSMLESLDDDCAKARLTTRLVEQRRMGTIPPSIVSDDVSEAMGDAPLSVLERADRLLEEFANQSNTIGTMIDYETRDLSRGISATMLAASESMNQDELNFLVDYLHHRDWIDGDTFIGGGSFVMTVDGYERIAMQHESITASDRAFVAMWFSDTMSDAWENGIKPAIEDAGYEPIRVDQVDHIGRIDDQIIAEIRRARFLVADFSQGSDGARGGVYYEAGFAHGLDIPVIFTCNTNSVEKLHFDTRQFNHIVWNTPHDLRADLRNRVMAVIGEGPRTKTI